MATIASLLINLGLDTAQLSAGAKKSSGIMSGLMKDLASRTVVAVDPMAMFGQAKAAAQAVGEFVLDEVKKLDDLGELAARLDISTEALTRLQWAAKRTGSDGDALAKVIEKMNVNLGKATAGSEMAENFERLGLDIKRLKEMDAGERLAAIADATGKLGNKTDTAAARAELLGKSYAELKLLLDGGSEAMAKFGAESDRIGATIGQEQVEAAAALQDQVDEMQKSFDKIKRDAALSIAPEMGGIAKHALEIADAFKKGDIDRALMLGMSGATFGLSENSIVAKHAETIRKNAKEGATAIAEQRKAAREAAAEVEHLAKASEKVADQIKRWEMDADTAGLSARAKEIAKLTREGGIDPEQVATLKRLADILDRADRSAKAVASHQADLKRIADSAIDPAAEHANILSDIGEALRANLITEKAAADLRAKERKRFKEEAEAADPLKEVRERAKARRLELSAALRRNEEQKKIKEEFDAGELSRDEAGAAHLLARLEFLETQPQDTGPERPAALEQGSAAAFSASFGQRRDPNSELLKSIREILKRIEEKTPEFEPF